MTERTCSDCPEPITVKSRSGRCRSCAARYRHTVPEMRDSFRLSMLRGAAKRLARPGEREKLRAAMLAHRKAWTPEQRAKQSSALEEAAMAWCPGEHRAEYRRVRKMIGAADARRIIEEQIAREERQRIAALTPLERQLERLRNGARLIERPDLRKADHAFTIGGVATGML